MTRLPKTMEEIRDAEAEKYYKESGFAPTEWAVMNFKAGFDCRDKIENEALKIAVRALDKIGHDIFVNCSEDHEDHTVQCFDLAQKALAEIRKLRPEL